jgi:cytochrome P450
MKLSSRNLGTRLERSLPPTAPMPGLLQTLGCQWAQLGLLEICRARYGDRFTLYPIGMKPVVFLSAPDDVHSVIAASAATLRPGAGTMVLAPLIGEHSFMLQDADAHMRGRKTIMPAFRRDTVWSEADAVRAIVASEVASWPTETVLSIHWRLRSLALRVITWTLFREMASLQKALQAKLLEMLTVTATYVIQQPRLRYLPGWRGTWRTFLRRRGEVDAIIATLIARARQDGAPEGTVLDLLLRAHNADGSPMSDKQVRDHLMSVILAGHETTASELAWAFQLLAHNPRVQERLIEEIDGEDGCGAQGGTDIGGAGAAGCAVGGGGAGDLGDAGGNGGGGRWGGAYLTATVQEVLRHRPVFLFAIPRVVAEPIEIGGWTYRPPAQLLGCIYLMHHDPELYEDPHEFRPERFLNSPPDPRTWLPWGGGRKRCPGHHLAMLEMQTVLRTTLATRRILPASGHMERARWRSVIVTPHAGSRVILRQRPGRRTR